MNDGRHDDSTNVPTASTDVTATPTDDRAALVSVLGRLLHACLGDERVFAAAAEAARGSDVKAALQTFELQRSKFALALRQRIEALGGRAEVTPTISIFQRAWMNIRTTLLQQGDRVLLAECLASEEQALRDYRQALTRQLPDAIRELLEEQHHALQRTHRALDALRRDATRARATSDAPPRGRRADVPRLRPTKGTAMKQVYGLFDDNDALDNAITTLERFDMGGGIERVISGPADGAEGAVGALVPGAAAAGRTVAFAPAGLPLDDRFGLGDLDGDARFFEQAIEDGAQVLIVKTEDVDLAGRILRDAGAARVSFES